MHSEGEPVRAKATLSLRFCPPERLDANVCSFSSKPTSRSDVVTNGLGIAAGGAAHEDLTLTLTALSACCSPSSSQIRCCTVRSNFIGSMYRRFDMLPDS